MNQTSSIFIAGHRGLVGGALRRVLQSKGFTNLITRSREELDLTNQPSVIRFFDEHRPEYVIDAAAKVGGIHANNTYPADFLYQNLQIQNNIIHAAYQTGVKKLLFLGSTCIYPRNPEIPIKEASLLTGPLEPTNEWYAIAKIAGLKMCEAYRKQYGCDFISVMPTNLYGPGDNYHPDNSHVIPGLLRRFHEAKTSSAASVTAWGTGSALREFMYVDDLAEACLFLMEHYSDGQTINCGTGEEFSIRQLTELVAETVGYDGRIEWDRTKPDGTPRKLIDSSRLFALGWKPKVSLREGLKKAYEDFLAKQGNS